MMMPCCELRFGVASGSGIYCDTLSVSQYDSKVRSHLIHVSVIGDEQSFLTKTTLHATSTRVCAVEDDTSLPTHVCVLVSAREA